MQLIALLLMILTPAFAAAPVGPKLAERLALEAVPNLEIVLSASDAQTASYTVLSPDGVAPVVGAVEAHLLGRGWASHPNITEAPAPDAEAEVVSFVQGGELLELRAAQPGEPELVTLELSLISFGSPEQLAGAP